MRRIAFRTAAVLPLLAWGFTVTAQAQPAMLTLACKGTKTDSLNYVEQPISMGIIVNLTNRTVQGFRVLGLSWMSDYPVMITAVNEMTVAFGGQSQKDHSSIEGSINRVTGDVEATERLYDVKTNVLMSTTTYALQCRPTQRMF